MSTAFARSATPTHATPPPLPREVQAPTGLTFRRLAIRRMAGIEPGFEIDSLGPGINVIFGPNGVGKSRTAHAINLALWPAARDRKLQRDWIWAAFEQQGQSWTVDVDADAIRYQCDGVDVAAAPSGMPPADFRDRYNLPLQDLLRVSDESFAQAILRESAGGYDLQGAIDALGFRNRSSRAGNEVKTLQGAIDAVKEAERELLELRQQEQELEQLIPRRDAARIAGTRVKSLQAALGLADAIDRHVRSKEAVDSFPGALARLAGNELQQLLELRNGLRTLERDVEQTRRTIADAQAEQQASRLAGQEIDSTLPATLSRRIQRLGELQALIVNQTSALHAAQAQRELERRKLGPTATDEKLDQVDIPCIEDLAHFAKEAEETRSQLHADRAVEEWIGGAQPPLEDLKKLESGLLLLNQWLRRPDAPAVAATNAHAPGDHSFWIIIFAGVVIIALSVLLAISVNPLLALAALIGLILFAAAFRSRPASSATIELAPASTDNRPFIESQYALLGIDGPPQWNATDVEKASAQLLNLVTRSRLDQEKADRWSALRARRSALRSRSADLLARRAELAQVLGCAPKTEEAELYVLAENIVRWQVAHRAVTGAEAAIRPVVAERDELLAACATSLERFGYSEGKDVAALATAADDLRKRIDHLDRSVNTIVTSTNAIQTLESRAKQQSEKIDALFRSLDVETDDETALRQLVEQRPAYAEAVQSLHQAAHELSGARMLLSAEPELQTRSRVDLQSELGAAEDRFSTLEELNKQITEIETAIALAKKGQDLEAALARRRDAVDAVRQIRDDDCDAAAGWLLAEHLRQVTADRNRPPVFNRARELFAKITQGRYRLEFEEGVEPRFRAIDVNSDVGQSLDELSSGTRLQLLLSVRVAFVEEQENGVRLPLILDETLGNSDEFRARAIIDATLEIARGGRQIIYFTAQPDEVGKWREILEGAGDVPHRLIDLAAVRGLAESDRMPLRLMTSVPAAEIPSPDGMTREAYGSLLKVPGINPMHEDAGGTHLWHLLDDMALLRRLLKFGVKTWGQWRTWVELGGGGGASANDLAAYRRAGIRAQLLETLARNWRIGRGRPIDRTVLIDSKAVSAKFLEEVAQLAAELKGDGRLLIARLQNGDVARFQDQKIAELSAYLEQAGYLDQNQPLDREQLRLRALAALSREVVSGDLASDTIDHLIDRWFLPT